MMENKPSPLENENIDLLPQTEEEEMGEEGGGFVAHLAQFDGPLDLLLHLVRKARINIQDIFVSQITEQYMAFMVEASELDMGSASQFLAMAATLLEIKSRSLLPKPVVQEEDEEDPEQALIRQLETYKLFKEASESLREMEQRQRDVFYKLPEEQLDNTREFVFDGVTPQQLYDAFQALLSRITLEAPPEPTHQIVRDTYTVTERALHLVRLLRQHGLVRFSHLFDDVATREEVVTTFLAMLDLMHQGYVKVSQPQLFDEITIELKKHQPEASNLNEVEGDIP
nr:segregation/condensation protein A [bacterium]